MFNEQLLYEVGKERYQDKMRQRENRVPVLLSRRHGTQVFTVRAALSKLARRLQILGARIRVQKPILVKAVKDMNTNDMNVVCC